MKAASYTNANCGHTDSVCWTASHHVVFVLGIAIHFLHWHHPRVQSIHELAGCGSVGCVFNAREAGANGFIDPAKELGPAQWCCLSVSLRRETYTEKVERVIHVQHLPMLYAPPLAMSVWVPSWA